uniref:TRPM SLOG domain-containing protein n=1 Tax=Amazona collaria TaxID=241587 RepID=A0A8B9FI53_9PSIT
MNNTSTVSYCLSHFMLNKWKLPAPNLVVSLAGEEENFQVKPWLWDTLKKGLIKAAQSTGAWIFTSALRVGITRHLVQAVRDHALASTSSKARVTNESLVSYQSNDNIQGPLYSLDHNHSHFILVDHITPDEPGGTTKLRLTLEKHISEQRTGYGGNSVVPYLRSHPTMDTNSKWRSVHCSTKGNIKKLFEPNASYLPTESSIHLIMLPF